MMQSFNICIVLAISIASTSCLQVHSNLAKSIRPERFILNDGLSPTSQNQIKEGFSAATHLADKIDKLDFKGALGQLAGTASSFLGALNPFVGFVLSFLGGDSPELQAIKRLYTAVENRFDQVDVQFAQLRRQVAFVPTQVHFADLEANINAVQVEMITLSKVTNKNGYNYEKNEFIKTFDRAYESSGIKLFNGIVHGGLTTGGIFHEFMTYSTYNRKETQKFMLGTMNLLMRAAALEITYAKLNGDPNIDLKKKDWVSRFNQVKQKMEGIDSETVKNYKTSMVTDVNDFATVHPKGSLSNSDFSNQLYSKLTTKFYWRDWLLIVADVQSTSHFISHACELNQNDNHGRKIVVASVAKTKTVASGSGLYGLKLERHTLHSSHPSGYTCVLSAQTPYNQLPDSARNHCSTYVAAGVYCSRYGDVHVHAASNRYHSRMPHSNTNRAFLFG